MSDPNWQDELTPVLRQLQIVVGALIAGCLIFLVVALVIGGRFAAGGGRMMSYVAVTFAVMALIVRMIVPGMIMSSGRRKIIRGIPPLPEGVPIHPRTEEFLERTGDAGKLAIVFNMSTIVSAALLEGPAFFALVAYLLEQSALSLVLAVVLIVGLVFCMPTRSRLVHWIEDQLAMLQQERHLGG